MVGNFKHQQDGLLDHRISTASNRKLPGAPLPGTTSHLPDPDTFYSATFSVFF